MRALLPCLLLAACGSAPEEPDAGPALADAGPRADAAPWPDAQPLGPLEIVAHSARTLFRYEPASDSMHLVGPLLWPELVGSDLMMDLAVDEQGQLWGVSDTRLYRVDPATAEVTVAAHVGVPFLAMIFTPSGLLGVTAFGSADVYTIDPATGATTPLGDLGGGLTANGDLARLGDTIYGVGYDEPSSGFRLLTIDPATGAATVVGVLEPYLTGLAAWDGQLYGFGLVDGTQSHLYRIDPATAAASDLGEWAIGWEGAASY